MRGVEEDEVGLDFEGVWVGGLVGWGCGRRGGGLTEDFAGKILAGGAGEVDG